MTAEKLELLRQINPWGGQPANRYLERIVIQLGDREAGPVELLLSEDDDDLSYRVNNPDPITWSLWADCDNASTEELEAASEIYGGLR